MDLLKEIQFLAGLKNKFFPVAWTEKIKLLKIPISTSVRKNGWIKVTEKKHYYTITWTGNDPSSSAESVVHTIDINKIDGSLYKRCKFSNGLWKSSFISAVSVKKPKEFKRILKLMARRINTAFLWQKKLLEA